MKKSICALVMMIFAAGLCFAEMSLPEPTQKPDAIYRLFKTTNMWTFIKLNTQDGRMWQVQFHNEDNNRFTVVLNDESLVDSQKVIPGRFTLYPTENIHTFILVDQIDGRTWQVQWSTEKNKRLILPIE